MRRFYCVSGVVVACNMAQLPILCLLNVGSMIATILGFVLYVVLALLFISNWLYDTCYTISLRTYCAQSELCWCRWIIAATLILPALINFIALHGTVETCQLNVYITWRRYWICIALDNAASSFQLNVYSAWRSYLDLYSSRWHCGIPLPSSAFIAVSVTRVNGLVAISTISICRFGLFATHVTGSRPRCPLRSHYLVCIKNYLFYVGIGPICDTELIYIFLLFSSVCMLDWRQV